MATKSSAAKKMDFDPTSFDKDQMPAATPEGQYGVRLKEIKKVVTGKKRPMLVLVWRVKSTAEKANKDMVGKTIDDTVYFADAKTEANANRMTKLKLRAFCDQFEVDYDLLPAASASSWKDFAEFIAACKGAEGDIWVSHRERNGETQANVHYKEAGGSGKLSGDDSSDDEDEDEDDEEDEEETPKKGAKGAKKTSTDDEDEDEDEDDEDSDDEDEDSDDDDEDDDEDEDEDEKRPIVRGRKPGEAPVGRAKKSAKK